MKGYIISIIVFVLISSVTFANSERVSLGYIYNSSKSHIEIVNTTNGNINTVSPTCFDLTVDGHLQINDIFNQEFVNDMHEQNILVTPFLSNHWARGKAEAALSNSEVLANEIVDAIKKYNLDGVNVDLENLLVRDKDNLTNFVKVLREKMPEGKILSVAVAANPKKLTNTWGAAYDYETLAKYADYLVLMAYDEHTAGGVEGPVASISFVDESIKVILEKVSRDKVVLGIPLYGRFWSKDSENGGEAIVIAQVERIASRYKNSVPIYNEEKGTITLQINVKEDERKAYVNGRYLKSGDYTIWYENEKTISRKLDLMNDYGLKGAALWALDNEYPEFWDYYEKGFYSEHYESEKSITERAYYEKVRIIISNAEPLKLEDKLVFVKTGEKEDEDKKINIDKNHIVHQQIVIKNNLLIESKVVMKERKYKKIPKIVICHQIKRYSYGNVC